MKILIYTHLILLLLTLLVKTEEKHDESCIPQNVTYALCVVNNANITVVSEPFTAELLGGECHDHFVEDLLGEAVCEEHEHHEKEGPTTAQRYGYGFLAVFVICFLSLAGLLAFPLIDKAAFQYVLTAFTALAVGTLLGDAMFHLIPFTLGLHSHESDEHDHGHGHDHRQAEAHSSVSVQVYQWKMFTAVMILYAFYLLEVFLHWFGHYRDNKNSVHSHAHSHAIQLENAPGSNQINHTASMNNSGNLEHDGHVHNHSHHHNYNEIHSTSPHIDKNGPDHTNTLETSVLQASANAKSGPMTINNLPKRTRFTGWMIIIGDGIHNFADGLAIGAAFSEDLMLGLTTTIAIGCHELPHEFGDYAVLIQSGFSHCRAILWNFLSATTAFIGFFIGAAVSTSENARQWIFAVTIGMFLYIALVDLLPTLLPEGRIESKRFICVNIGFLIGITIMFLLAIFEDKLIGSGH